MNDSPEAVDSPAGMLPAGLVILAWLADSPGPVDRQWLERLQARAGGPVYSVGDWRETGLTALGRHRHDFDGAVAAAGKLHLEHSILLLRAGLEPPAPLPAFERIFNSEDRPGQVVFPGNHADRLNPFHGWPQDIDIERPARLVHWCGEGVWQALESAAPDCLLLTPKGAKAPLNAGQAHLVDDAFVLDPARPVRPGKVQPFEAPALIGQLALRLRHLALSGAQSVAESDPDQPVTLHVAHGWGGGVWRWIEDFIAGDADGMHLVLVAEGDGDGGCCGRRLRLFLGGVEQGLIREYALAPEIGSSAVGHAQYRAVLGQVIERFGVGRVIVSSLIGHSLDCLATGLPTLQVLHDFYPLWPLLDFDPLAFAGNNGAIDLERALAEHGDSLRMRPADAVFWRELGRAWVERVQAGEVMLAAPTGHVIRRWQALCPEAGLQIQRIAHAFRSFDDARPVAAPAGGPLRLLIPGRLTRGKGLELLKAALPELRRHARLFALGCGRDGFALFGQPGIDLVINYRHADFPALVEQVRPHAALFLSTVPETWNYALSEVRALGVVPVATRVGSFPERIRDGKDGLLFEPEPAALIELVRRLSAEPGQLAGMAGAGPKELAPEEMVREYDRRLPPRVVPPGPHRPAGPELLESARLAARLVEMERQLAADRARLDAMQEELERRARWAQSLDRDLAQARTHFSALQAEFEERTRWASSLERELEKTRTHFSELRAEFEQQQHELQDTSARLEDTSARLEDTSARLEDLAQRHGALERDFDQVIHSRSWRITRPLRVAARVARNARARGVFNPLNWPRLLGRLVHHLKLRGLRRTLVLMQSPPVEAEAVKSPPLLPVPEVSEVAAPVHHRRPERPEVSLIVPVYNQLHYTSACLESLLAAEIRVPFEVIVVDDCSSDDTRAWLKQCTGIGHVRNRSNLGFIGSCNRGAKKAVGQWLVFLNNDTRVTDGWLDALIKTFAEHEDAGIVGGKLVFGDGTLQEAGGIIFADGSGWNHGRGEDPGRPEYGFVSEADYVSGACLAIERERFLALGGFDRRYAPAYYEDTDLCFKVRAQGLKVLYQPAARVIHYEGGTSGTDETAGIKQHQVTNRRKFRERWAEILADYPENPQEYTPALALAHRYRNLPRRALVIDATTPMPDHDSGSVRMFALLQLLVELGYRTSFMPQNLARAGRHSSALEQAGIEVLTAPWIPDPEPWLAEHGRELDLVMVSRHYVLAPLIRMIRAYCPNARLVFDTVDLHFLREQREAELAGSASAGKLAEKTRAVELGLIRDCDATFVVSEFEKKLLADLVPDADVRVVSNIHSLRDPGKPFEQRRDLVFVGGFQHPPNIDAADWLIGEILPRVHERLPEVKLHLIGSRMPERIVERRAPGLRVHGFVADLEPFMTGCRISVAPLRYGAGVKGKVNQAMSHGLPVVATSCAAEGMYAEHEVDILMADDAEGFAAEVVRLYQDAELWNRLAVSGRANVERHFSVAAARRELEELLNN